MFSWMDDRYAFGEMDEVGKTSLAAFAAESDHRSAFDLMSVEGRVYFTRKAPRYRAHLVQFSTSPSPTTLRSILLINSVLCASAAFMSVIVCFKVLALTQRRPSLR